MQTLLEKIDYKKYAWNICGDFKALLLGLQLGYTKFSCFLCEWDSRATDKHYLVREWKKHHNLVPGEKNVMNNPLVEPNNVFLPPLQMKNFVKALKPDGKGFL